MSCLTGLTRANQSPSSHYTFFSEIIHNADASTLTEDPAINTAARSAQLDIFPQIKGKTQLSKNCGNPAFIFDFSL